MNTGLDFDFPDLGMADVATRLRQLPNNVQNNIMRNSAKAALKPMLEAALAAAPNSGKNHKSKLKDAITISSKIDKRRDFGRKDSKYFVRVFMGVTGRAPHAHLVEYGTKRRFKHGKKKMGRKEALRRVNWVGYVSTGSMPANPFMKNVAAAYNKQVIETLGTIIRKKLATALRNKKYRAGG